MTSTEAKWTGSRTQGRGAGSVEEGQAEGAGSQGLGQADHRAPAGGTNSRYRTLVAGEVKDREGRSGWGGHRSDQH
jgi:hypothetical protein